MRYIGCNADTYWLVSIVGDELALRAEVISKVDSADNGKLMALMLRFIRNAPEPALALRMAQAIANDCAQLP